MVLSAADEVTRQHCMRIIEAASSGISSPLQGIASAEALTRNLLDMKSLSAINAVFVVLGIAMSDPRLKAVGNPESPRGRGVSNEKKTRRAVERPPGQ